MNNYENAGKGLRKMYVSVIGIMVSGTAIIVPLIGPLVAIIGILVFAIMDLYGLYLVGKDIKGCKIAFVLTIAWFPLSVILNVVGRLVADSSIVDGIHTIVSNICPIVAECLVLYFVAKVLKMNDKTELAKQGMNVMWIIVISNVVTFFCDAFIEAVGSVFQVMLFSLGVSIAALVYQLKFYKKSAEQFGYYF